MNLICKLCIAVRWVHDKLACRTRSGYCSLTNEKQTLVVNCVSAPGGQSLVRVRTRANTSETLKTSADASTGPTTTTTRGRTNAIRARWNFIHQLPRTFAHRNVTVVDDQRRHRRRHLERPSLSGKPIASGSRRDATDDSSSSSTSTHEKRNKTNKQKESSPFPERNQPITGRSRAHPLPSTFEPERKLEALN